MNVRNILKSLAVSSDSEPAVEPFITHTKAALVAVLQELSENNLNLHLRVQKTSKQLTTGGHFVCACVTVGVPVQIWR